MKRQPVIIITGSRKGIGRYLSESYAAQGWKVIGVSRGVSDFIHQNYEHHRLDVSEEKAVVELFRTVRHHYNCLDALINNAGIASMNSTLLTTAGRFHQILQTNVIGAFLFCREAAKLMCKSRQGRIVNFTTIAVPLQLEGEAAYVASKAAVSSLTQILAKELAPFGITVNSLGPTPIETDLIKSIPNEKISALLKRQAIPRFGTFEDIANVIRFFLAPESSFITGQTIYLGGVS